ncbi:MAG: hypothetical protein IPJ65_00955 [Archangiaceae bacterium]|nr:hypothetical protein [Archangiaceae bacterium]
MAELSSVQHESEVDLDVDIEIIIDERCVPAADLLSDADNATRETRPYEVPLEEELGELFGDLTRTSGQFTLPVALDELPEDAYPTEVYFIDPSGSVP